MGRSAVAPGARSLQPGTRLGNYVLLEKLARGGMAEVYLGRVRGADRFRKVVAIKLVLPHLVDDEKFVAMFRREAKLSAKLDHPNIAQVLDLGYADGEYFIAIEYVHGQTLASILRASNERRMLPLSVGLTTVSSACAGLHYAHERDLIHRDVSPANVMVRYDGTVKVLDFGIAKAAEVTNATRTGTLKGKVGYMSPEQCKGGELDRRSDVFALGILLYEGTTGRRLFYGDNEFAVMNKIVDGEFDAPSSVRDGYPRELEAVVMRALQSDPAARFPTAEALQGAIEEAAAAIGERTSTLALAEHMRALFGEPAYPTGDAGDATGSEPMAVETPSLESITITPSRRRGPWIAAAAVAVALGGGAAWIASSSADAPAADRVAEPEEPEPEAAPVEQADPSDDAGGPGEVQPTPAADAELPAAENPERATTRKKRKSRRKKPGRRSKKTDRNTFFRRGVIAGLALAVMLAGSPESDRAAELAEQARLAFEAGDYEEAVELVDEAFALDPKAEYLYALAQAERMAGRCEDAIEHYRAFLAADPPPEVVENTRANMAECEEKLKQPEPEPERKKVAPPVVVPPPQRPPPVERQPWHRDPLGGVLLGVGAAALVGGLTMYGVSAARIQSPESAMDLEDYERRAEAARPFGFAGIGIASAGAALIIGAIIRYAVIRRRGG